MIDDSIPNSGFFADFNWNLSFVSSGVNFSIVVYCGYEIEFKGFVLDLVFEIAVTENIVYILRLQVHFLILG